VFWGMSMATFNDFYLFSPSLFLFCFLFYLSFPDFVVSFPWDLIQIYRQIQIETCSPVNNVATLTSDWLIYCITPRPPTLSVRDFVEKGKAKKPPPPPKKQKHQTKRKENH
jgi:hypothetical protein